MTNWQRGALSLGILFFIEICAGASASAREDFNPRPGLFRIRQESLDQNGVLVSRPLSVDQEIMNFLSLNDIRSVDDYARWLNSHIRYHNDPTQDIWNSPLETLKKQKGNCKDFATLNSAVLQVMGYQPHLLALVSPHYSHAICVFEKNGVVYWFDNAQIKETSAPGIEHLARQLVEQYGYSASLELNLINRQWRMLYQKS